MSKNTTVVENIHFKIPFLLDNAAKNLPIFLTLMKKSMLCSCLQTPYTLFKQWISVLLPCLRVIIFGRCSPSWLTTLMANNQLSAKHF
jgi:hypothetical protein